MRPLKVWLISSNIAQESEYYTSQFKHLEEKLHIQIELRLMTWNRAFDTMIDSFKNDAAPDVFSLGTTWVHTLCYLGYLAPIPPSFKIKPSLADWMEDCIHFNNVRYVVPFLCETYVLMARKRTLEKLSIEPKMFADWEGFFSVCRRISEYYKSVGINEHIPLAFPIRPELGTLHRFCVWMFKGGWTFPKLNQGIKTIFRSDISIKTLNYITNLIKVSGADIRFLQTDTQSILDQFTFSDQPFTFFIGNGQNLVIDVMNDNKETEICLHPLPSLVPNGKTFGGGSVLAVSSKCKYQEVAWKIVDFLTGEEVLSCLSSMNGSIPSYNSSFWAEYGSNPNIQVIKRELENSTTYAFHPLWHAIEQNSGEYVAHYFWESLGNSNREMKDIADETLKYLDEEILSLLNMMWEMQ